MGKGIVLTLEFGAWSEGPGVTGKAVPTLNSNRTCTVIEI